MFEKLLVLVAILRYEIIALNLIDVDDDTAENLENPDSLKDLSEDAFEGLEIQYPFSNTTKTISDVNNSSPSETTSTISLSLSPNRTTNTSSVLPTKRHTTSPLFDLKALTELANVTPPFRSLLSNVLLQGGVKPNDTPYNAKNLLSLDRSFLKYYRGYNAKLEPLLPDEVKDKDLTINDLKRLGVSFPPSLRDDKNRNLTLKDLKELGVSLPDDLKFLANRSVSDLRRLGIQWPPEDVELDRPIAADDLKMIGFDWDTDSLLHDNRKIILRDLKKVGVTFPPDRDPDEVLKMEDLNNLKARQPLPPELNAVSNLKELRKLLMDADMSLKNILKDMNLLFREPGEDVEPFYVPSYTQCDQEQSYRLTCYKNATKVARYEDNNINDLPVPARFTYWCWALKTTLQCMTHWLKTCGSKLEHDDVMAGKSYILEHVCDSDDLKSRYSSMRSCYDALNIPWNECSKSFVSAMKSIYNSKPTKYDICCEKTKFFGCVLNATKHVGTAYKYRYCYASEITTIREFTEFFGTSLAYQACDFKPWEWNKCFRKHGPISMELASYFEPVDEPENGFTPVCVPGKYILHFTVLIFSIRKLAET